MRCDENPGALTLTVVILHQPSHLGSTVCTCQRWCSRRWPQRHRSVTFGSVLQCTSHLLLRRDPCTALYPWALSHFSQHLSQLPL
jgi:hypothetical protein